MVPPAAWALIVIGIFFVLLALCWLCAAGTGCSSAVFCGRLGDCFLVCAGCFRESARCIAFCCRGCREEERRGARVKKEDEGGSEDEEEEEEKDEEKAPPPPAPVAPSQLPNLALRERELYI